jgi:hypothetical protein
MTWRRKQKVLDQSLNGMIAAGLAMFLAASAPASACTGIRLKAGGRRRTLSVLCKLSSGICMIAGVRET